MAVVGGPGGTLAWPPRGMAKSVLRVRPGSGCVPSALVRHPHPGHGLVPHLVVRLGLAMGGCVSVLCVKVYLLFGLALVV